MQEQNLIQAEGLSRRYGPTLAVDGLDLSLRKGEILGLLGPNGAGKSTTMKMLTGCLAPSGGHIRICGHDLQEQPEAAKRHIGYMPEIPPLYPELSVEEMLAFAARLHGVPRQQRAAAVERAIASCGLQGMRRRLVGNLSKGYQQRVGLAQAIIHNPDVIVLDEPTIGLDPIQIREIRALIAELGRAHSVLISSHILPEVQAVCDRVMIVAGGKVVYADSVAETAKARYDSVVIGLRRPPETDTLAALTDVERIEALDAHRFRLHCRTDSTATEAWAAEAVRNDWGLFELNPERRTLEDVFVELTAGDRAAPAPETQQEQAA